MNGYAGPGYVGTLRAAYIIARKHNHERWNLDDLSASEKFIWNGLMSNPDVIQAEYYLDFLDNENDDPARRKRCEDFYRGLNDLHYALASGKTQAFYREDDGSLRLIKASDWNGSAAGDVLEVGWTRTGLWREGKFGPDRFIIIPLGDVLDLDKLSTKQGLPIPDEQGSQPVSLPSNKIRRRQATTVARLEDVLIERYPKGDPIKKGFSREAVRSELARELKIPVSYASLDRARAKIWRS